MSLEYIRNYYKVPAEIGRRVEYTSETGTKQGVIVGAWNQYIQIHFDGEKKPAGVFHPTWKMKYLEMGEVPQMTRAQRRYQQYQQSDGWDNFMHFLRGLSVGNSLRRRGLNTGCWPTDN